jgi:uncharacterized protein GlcG (DUF336 family)
MKIAASQDVVHWEAAAAAVAAAVRHAEEAEDQDQRGGGDSGGNLAAFLRMPGASLHRSILRSTRRTRRQGSEYPRAHGQARSSRTRCRAGPLAAATTNGVFGGGLPIRYEGKVVGGIGVSGGSEDEDEACARAGLAAIGLAGYKRCRRSTETQ